jgi:hypothetical protein
MDCPTKEQIIEVAEVGGVDVKKALEKLFPGVLEQHIRKGEVYSWGTHSKRAWGVVVQHPDMPNALILVNLHNGDVIIPYLPATTIMRALDHIIATTPDNRTYNCYTGSITGPKRIATWGLK